MPPMKIEINQNKQPVNLGVIHYPSTQSTLLRRHFNQLLKIAFMVPNPYVTWQAAPHLVLKESPTTPLRIAIDLRIVNAAKKGKPAPMPYLGAEFADFAGSQHFAALYFCGYYWQILLHPSSHDGCRIIITPQGAYVATRVLQSL